MNSVMNSLAHTHDKFEISDEAASFPASAGVARRESINSNGRRGLAVP
jgi:hypothetical protein